MNKIRIKFCGITNKKDAENAIVAGANALGFVFYKKSPRYISPEDAYLIIKKLPPLVPSVGVFVNEDLGGIEKIAEVSGINTVQLHGDEDVKYCLGFKNLRNNSLKLIKAIRVKDEESIKAIEECPADAFLLDSYKDTAYGGTGKGFDRKLAIMAKEYGRRLIISGGLTVDNVYDVIKEIRPYGVDVSSGIESEPGKKNIELMEEFTKEVRRAEEDA